MQTWKTHLVLQFIHGLFAEALVEEKAERKKN